MHDRCHTLMQTQTQTQTANPTPADWVEERRGEELQYAIEA